MDLILVCRSLGLSDSRLETRLAGWSSQLSWPSARFLKGFPGGKNILRSYRSHLGISLVALAGTEDLASDNGLEAPGYPMTLR